MIGQGIKKDIWGKVFEGQFENDKLNGQGKITDKGHGVFFEGNFLNEVLHGQGKIIIKESGEHGRDEIIEGIFENGKLKEGKIIDLREDVVSEGTFENGKLKKGKINFQDGRMFQGTFDTDKFRTLIKGKITDVQGNIYEGSFKNNKLENIGKITYKDGIEAEGLFINGKLKNGTITYDDRVEQGEFKNGKLVEGCISYDDGNVVEVLNEEGDQVNMVKKNNKRSLSDGEVKQENLF